MELVKLKGKRIRAVFDLDTFLDRRSRNLQGWSCRLPLFGGRHGALPPKDNKNEGASGDMYENKGCTAKGYAECRPSPQVSCGFSDNRGKFWLFCFPGSKSCLRLTQFHQRMAEGGDCHIEKIELTAAACRGADHLILLRALQT